MIESNPFKIIKVLRINLQRGELAHIKHMASYIILTENIVNHFKVLLVHFILKLQSFVLSLFTLAPRQNLIHPLNSPVDKRYHIIIGKVFQS